MKLQLLIAEFSILKFCFFSFRATEAPQFVLGILHESEIWNLEWFPQDLSSDSTNENLARLGMLATASDDGIVRVWSICDPNQLVNEDRYELIVQKFN